MFHNIVREKERARKRERKKARERKKEREREKKKRKREREKEREKDLYEESEFNDLKLLYHRQQLMMAVIADYALN